MTLPMSLKNIQDLIYEELKIKRSTSTIRDWMNNAGIRPIRTRPRLYHPSDVSKVLWGNSTPVSPIIRRKPRYRRRGPIGGLVNSNGIYTVLPKHK